VTSEALRIIKRFAGLNPTSGLFWLWLAILSLAPIFSPWSDFVGHPHWDNIRWIPFQDFSFSPRMLKDVFGNLVWFMMFGVLLYHRLNDNSAPLRTIAIVTLIAGGISLSIEFFQVFTHNRIPSTTDVLCDTIGAGLGGYLANTCRALLVTEPVRPLGIEAAGPRIPR
jgi:glycopeptide antibiotics resistance protein